MAAILGSITDMARQLALQVVVEGVENGAQLALLQSVHCQYVQGFVFSKPLDGARATALLERGTSLAPAVTHHASDGECAANRPANRDPRLVAQSQVRRGGSPAVGGGCHGGGSRPPRCRRRLLRPVARLSACGGEPRRRPIPPPATPARRIPRPPPRSRRRRRQRRASRPSRATALGALRPAVPLHGHCRRRGTPTTRSERDQSGDHRAGGASASGGQLPRGAEGVHARPRSSSQKGRRPKTPSYSRIGTSCTTSMVKLWC